MAVQSSNARIASAIALFVVSACGSSIKTSSSSVGGSSGAAASAGTGATGYAGGSSGGASSGGTSSGGASSGGTGSGGIGNAGAANGGGSGGASSGGIIFGMYNNTAIPPGAEQNTAANFRVIANKWFVGSKIKVHRVFNSGLPSTYSASAGAQDPASGNVSFLSVKPPGGDHAGVAAGTDATIQSLAASIPAGSYFTMFHEPENDMTGADFVAMFRHFYSVAKAANSALTIGYIAMSYQWRPASTSTANEDAWYPGADSTDFLAVDAYDAAYKGPHSLDTDADFQRWYAWASAKDKPLLITEYGIQSADSAGGFSDAQRASILTQSIAWVHTQPRIHMMLYWNGTDATPGGINWFMNPTTSFPTDNYAQVRAAWNAGITEFGSTGTSY